MADPAAADVVRNAEASRYELVVDGAVRGIADFRVEPDGRVAFVHTEMDRTLRGKGFSPVLVARALDDVRASGRRAVSRCWYVTKFAREHPEYADLFGA